MTYVNTAYQSSARVMGGLTTNLPFLSERVWSQRRERLGKLLRAMVCIAYLLANDRKKTER